MNAADQAQYHLVVSTYSNNHSLVETAQTTASPIVVTNGAEELLLWLDEYHLQFPLDNIGDGSYIIVEFKRKLPASEETLSWCHIPIDKSKIDTETLHVDLCAPPKVLTSKPTGLALSPSQSSFDLEVIISKRTGKETMLF